jgi:stress response protein SCP2
VRIVSGADLQWCGFTVVWISRHPEKYKMSVGPHFVTLRCDNSIKIDFDCFVTHLYKTIKMRPNRHFVFFTLENTKCAKLRVPKVAVEN